MATTDLTCSRLRELIKYDPETGIFIRIVTTSPNAIAGRKAGGYDAYGYINISIDKKIYKAHRLAWLYVYGKWPLQEIDHINGIKDDNRICNLRDVGRIENGRNHVRPTKRNISSGVLGVTPCGDKWRAAVSVSKKRVHVGVFATKEEAYEAYIKAKRVLHEGGCTL